MIFYQFPLFKWILTNRIFKVIKIFDLSCLFNPAAFLGVSKTIIFGPTGQKSQFELQYLNRNVPPFPLHLLKMMNQNIHIVEIPGD